MTNGSIKILLAAFLAGAIFSCDEDSTSTIGSSLTGSNVEITVDSAFTVTGNTLRRATIRPKASELILGSLTVDNYGSITSDIVAQFLPSTELDTTFTYQNVDSIFLSMRYALGNYIGDSIAPLGLTVYPLNKLLPRDIASDFDPEGYYDKKPLASTTYNTLPESNPLNSAGNYREILIKLPTELGRNLFKSFEDNPANFANGQLFSENVFPGLYIKSSFGSGRMTVMGSTSLMFYLRKIVPKNETENDTTDAVHQYMLVTPEVVSNNDLEYKMSPTLQTIFDEGHNLLVAPAGYEMEIRFPAPEIIEAYRKGGKGTSVLNSLTMTIQADSIENNGKVTPPPYLLMVLKKDRDEFFAKNKLTDNISSFYATYSSELGTYSFSGLRNYILDLLEKEEITEDDYIFSLVPVQVNFEAMANSSYYSQEYTESDIQPYLLSPVMATVDLDKTKIKMTYTRQID